MESVKHNLKLPALMVNLREMRTFSEEVLKSIELDDEVYRQLVLAIDEAAANVVEHAYPTGQEQTVEIVIHADSGRITIEVRDRGVLFNPFDVKPRNRQGSFVRRGFGLPLMRRIMDKINYERLESGENVLTLVKKLDTG
jgi:serine/threonine-protein kinase RsbW